MTASLAIEAKGLSKAFGVVAALRKVDLSVQRGRFAALLGPNGAGKTTLLRILATLSRPSAGSAQILGYDAIAASAALRAQIGLISHQLYVYPQLTAAENLRFFGRLYGLVDLEGAVQRALDEVQLLDVAHRPCETFSRGMQQRLSIARALLHRPSLVLLDEPFTGLDHHAASVLTELLITLRDGERTFVMVSHNLEQVGRLADEAHVLARGRLVGSFDVNEAEPRGVAERYTSLVSDAALRRAT